MSVVNKTIFNSGTEPGPTVHYCQLASRAADNERITGLPGDLPGTILSNTLLDQATGNRYVGQGESWGDGADPEVWYCSNCGWGPHNPHIDVGCANCGRIRGARRVRNLRP